MAQFLLIQLSASPFPLSLTQFRTRTVSLAARRSFGSFLGATRWYNYSFRHLQFIFDWHIANNNVSIRWRIWPHRSCQAQTGTSKLTNGASDNSLCFTGFRIVIISTTRFAIGSAHLSPLLLDWLFFLLRSSSSLRWSQLGLSNNLHNLIYVVLHLFIDLFTSLTHLDW